MTLEEFEEQINECLQLLWAGQLEIGGHLDELRKNDLWKKESELRREHIQATDAHIEREADLNFQAGKLFKAVRDQKLYPAGTSFEEWAQDFHVIEWVNEAIRQFEDNDPDSNKLWEAGEEGFRRRE